MTANTADKQTASEPRPALDWPRFTDKLAAVLEGLEEEEFLICAVKGTNRFVQFSAQGDNGMRVETTSNAFLSGAQRLDESQIAALHRLGWFSPTGTPAESATPELDPDGSPNFYTHVWAPVPFRDVARLAVRTLTEVLGVPDPGCLEHTHLSESDGEIVWPKLDL